MIKALLVNACNMNQPNGSNETPFYLLLKNPIVEFNLIKFIIDNTRIDYYSQRSKDIATMMKERGFAYPPDRQVDFIMDTNFIAQHLSDWSESQLAENLELWKKNVKSFDDGIMELLEAAIVKNLPETVRILMDLGANINEIPKNSKFKMTPGFLACTFGYHAVMKVLLSNMNMLSFKSPCLQRNLLHQLFASETVDAVERQKTFDLIIADERCTLDIINQTDAEDRVPLYFACKYECADIIKELLRRGAYVGYETVLNYIKKETLGDFLDECVKCSSDITDRECETFINYRFLMPPDRKKLEITPVHLISVNPNLKDFILHPVISSFVLLKWRKIDFIVYLNMIVYFSFLIFLGFTVVGVYDVSDDVSEVSHDYDDFKYDKSYCDSVLNYNGQLFPIPITEFRFDKNESINIEVTITMLLFQNLNTTRRLYGNDTLVQKNVKKENFVSTIYFETNEKWKFYFRQYFDAHPMSYWFGVFGLGLMAAYESVQCIMSLKKYFFKPINWLDISLIAISFTVLVRNVDVGRENFKKLSAVMILLMGAQSMQLFSKVSVFSLSLHMAILHKVCKTFLKTIAPYMILISAFGMSFFALNYDEYDGRILTDNVGTSQAFSNPFLSTISTVRMMLSDFDGITIRKDDHFQTLLFLAFMITISTVLLNLLNALAITDTNQMMEVAEFVDLKTRISTIRTYESLYSFFNVTYANVFPEVFTIMLTPNKHSYIKIKQSVRVSDNAIIFMQKVGKISNFEYVYANWVFRTIFRQRLQFDEKLLTKVVEFVKNKQQNLCKDTNDITDYKDELCAMIRTIQEDMYREIRVAKDDMHKEMLKISNETNLLKRSDIL